MGKRYFDVSAAELAAHDSLMLLDQAIGTATRDMRVVWYRTGSATQTYIDFYAEHASDANVIGNPRALAMTAGGNVTGIVRVNYDDTQPIDRVCDSIRFAREVIAQRGMQEDWFSNGSVMQDVLAALKHGEICFHARGRYEGHVAANS